jgi:hypothetical protein
MIYMTIRIDIPHDEPATPGQIESKLKAQAVRWGEMIRCYPHTRSVIRSKFNKTFTQYYMKVGYKQCK